MSQLNDYQVLIRPISTEKSVQGTFQSKYTFEVDVRANKLQIAEAVSIVFDVDVVKVNVMNNARKYGTWGRKRTKRSAATKKAIVTLAPGQRIDALGV